MHSLLGPGEPGRPITSDEVADTYPWPDAGPWVRAMMVTTLDGAAAGPDLLSGSISSDADMLVFNAVRRHADVVLAGAGTLRAEEYSPLKGDRVLAFVSGSLDLPWHLPLWAESDRRPIVLTGPSPLPASLETAEQHADVVRLDSVTARTILDALVGRGLRKVVCEGGPRLLHEFVAADLLDEADISFSPTFAGTAHTPTTPSLPDVSRFRLVSVLHGDDFLMARYLGPGR